MMLTIGMTISAMQLMPVFADIKSIPGLVRYYAGDGSLEDSSGSGISLNVHSGTTITGVAQYETIPTAPFSSTSRQVFKLDGSRGDGYHLRSSNSGMPLVGAPRTMMGWARIDKDNVGYGATVFAYGSPGYRYMFDLLLFTDGTVGFDLWGTCDGDVNPIVPNYRDSFGVWKHYALTYDSNQNPQFKAYVNGALVKQGSFPSSLDTQSGDFIVGGRIQYSGETFYGAAAEIAVFNRVLTASEINTVVNTDTAGGGGDPHFFGFGGMFFTWQGQCDLVLLKTPKTSNTGSNIEIHIRTRRVRSWSAIDTIVFKIGNDIGEIRSTEGNLFLNGSEAKPMQIKSLDITKSISPSQKRTYIYKIVFDKDKNLEVRANIRTKMIYATLSGNFPPGTTGLLGSPHDPGMFTRDGIKMVNDKDVNIFVETWQVRDTDPQLFFERATPQFPEKCIYKVPKTKSRNRSRRLKEKPQVSMEEASRLCAPHRPGPMKDNCIDDVISTGDIEIAKDDFYG